MYRRLQTVITRVIDGDTFTIAWDIGDQPCRLKHVDAPERGEPFYREAKNYIQENFANKEVWVTATGIDRYGRWLVEVEHNTEFILHYQLIQLGLAFHYTKYSKDQICFVLQKQAQAKGIGLWSIPNSYSKWKERLKNKEEYEKKKERDFGKIPWLVLVLEGKCDSEFEVSEIPEFMVDCRNFKNQEEIFRAEKPLETLGSYQWGVLEVGGVDRRCTSDTEKTTTADSKPKTMS